MFYHFNDDAKKYPLHCRNNRQIISSIWIHSTVLRLIKYGYSQCKDTNRKWYQVTHIYVNIPGHHWIDDDLVISGSDGLCFSLCCKWLNHIHAVFLMGCIYEFAFWLISWYWNSACSWTIHKIQGPVASILSMEYYIACTIAFVPSVLEIANEHNLASHQFKFRIMPL